MNLKNVIEGLQIFQKYFADPNGYYIGVGYDEISVRNTDQPIYLEDLEILETLGWFQPETGEGVYDPDEYWVAYV